MKIFVRLAGGLGNQLFQLAAALRLRQHTGGQIVLDSGDLESYAVKRDFLLPQLLALSDMQVATGFPSKMLRQAVKIRLGKLPLVGVSEDYIKGIGEGRRAGEMKFSKLRILDGYYQHCWNYSALRSVISEFRLLGDDIDEPSNRLSIHCRGGDFLADSSLNLCTAEWYGQALLEMEKHIRIPETVDLVCEDLTYSAGMAEGISRISGYKVIARLPGDPLSDFRYLLNSRYLISGNSTFSFWASALSAASVSVVPTHLQMGSLRPKSNMSEILLDIRLSGC